MVWARGEKAPGNFVYTIIGTIVTDEPIDVGFTHDGGYIDGETHGGILPLIKCLRTYAVPYRFGDAAMVLVSLGNCDPANDGPVTEPNNYALLKGYPQWKALQAQQEAPTKPVTTPKTRKPRKKKAP